jgi:Outer membrane protein beta-barrel domain
MKKILTSLALLVTFTQASKAQFDIHYGIEAGFSGTNITTYEFATHGSSITGVVTNSKFSGRNFSGGGFAEFALGDHFAVQGGVYIAAKGAKSYNFTALEIPLIAEWKFDEGHGFLVYAGSYFDFIVHTNDDVSVGKPDVSSYYKLGVNFFHFGAKGGIGYQFRNGIFLKAGYQLGVSKIATANYYDETVSYNGIVFNLGFLFHTRSRHRFY